MGRSHRGAARDEALAAAGVTAFDVYDLPAAGLDGFAGRILSGRVDQELWHRHRDVTRAYLDGGGTVVFSGQLFRPWLPGSSPFVLADGDGDLPTSPDRDGGPAVTLADHPVHAGVEPADLGDTFVYRHGHHPLPAGADVLVTLAGGRPALTSTRSARAAPSSCTAATTCSATPAAAQAPAGSCHSCWPGSLEARDERAGRPLLGLGRRGARLGDA